MVMLTASDPQTRRARRPRVAALVERRFPLHLEPTLYTIRDLYESAKLAHWDPETGIPWTKFDAAAYSAEQRRAAALSWSRRAWTEYSGLPETPAILIRFCLEHNGESDPKMFLTVRGSEEAWHTECCWRFAELLGGYVDAPAEPAYAQLFNQDFHREAFDPGLSVDAYVAVHAALLDGLDLALHRGFLRHAVDPVAQAILKRLVEDKERHVAFGWRYLSERAPAWDGAVRGEIAGEIEQVLEGLVYGGYVSPWLAPAPLSPTLVEADAITRQAGLGAMLPEEEAAIIGQYLDEAAGRLAQMQVPVRGIRSGLG
ncbi:MAG: hypothetical protein AB7L76_22300 [Burkholderiaceae bacterium]